jgi:L-seryl-tRNA(Ser) seleniumtransferase
MSRQEGLDLRRRIPSVDQVLQQPEVQALERRHGRAPLLRRLRRELDQARERAASGDLAALGNLLDDLPGRLQRGLERDQAPSLVPLLNATGVVVHTNLGRAPLPASALERVAAVAAGYSNLEFDLEHGERGSREDHAESRLRELLGVEASVVVNNNAAAVLLAVNSLAEGREVVVSRGELVEIGGSFRIPDVLRKGGARLREVGTTNRTRVSDYEAAIGPETAMILKVHPSNFRIVGFSEAPSLLELGELARRKGLPLVEDLGSGSLSSADALAGEPTVLESLRAGPDVVTFSGDKLLGGPQAGLVAGRRALVDAMRRNPLYRALRVDKMTLAALDAVLIEHAAGRGVEALPVLRMLAATRAELRQRARALATGLGGRHPALVVELRDGVSAVGGGAAPTLELPTCLVALSHPSLGAERLAAALRAGSPAVVARVAEGRLLIDLRTIAPADEPVLLEALSGALQRALGTSTG